MLRPLLRWSLPLAAALLWPRAARADVTSWLSIAGGAAQVRHEGLSPTLFPQMPVDLGVGGPPSMPVMVGLGVKLNPYFGEGVDYAAYLRGATRGYVLGGYGVALDAGAFTRSFGGSSGFLGVANVGLPWGAIVSLNYERGFSDGQVLGASVGIDFLRLTVYRLSGQEQWPNVYPAWRGP